MEKIWRWYKEEMYKIIPAITYFIIAFNLIHFTENLSKGAENISYYGYGAVTLAALIVGKVMIIVNALPILNAFPDKPLIYNILWKLWVYYFFVLVFWFIDDLIHLYTTYGSIGFIGDRLAFELTSPLFWSIQLWLIVVFGIFVMFTEIAHTMGPGKMYKLLFGYPRG